MTTADRRTPLDDRREIDELIPEEVEDGPLTWLDHAGLDRELDAAADLVGARLVERGERAARGRIKAALAKWLLGGLLAQLAGAEALLEGGSEHFFSVLGRAALTAGEDMPPPPAAQAQDAAGGRLF